MSTFWDFFLNLNPLNIDKKHKTNKICWISCKMEICFHLMIPENILTGGCTIYEIHYCEITTFWDYYFKPIKILIKITLFCYSVRSLAEMTFDHILYFHIVLPQFFAFPEIWFWNLMLQISYIKIRTSQNCS